MYYIDDYKKQAINKIIPYLIEFPQIVSIIENSADRYQAIEDVLWRIGNNFRVINARGVFLDAIAHNEVVDIVYTDKAKDAFTYGTQEPMYQAYGTGHYYSQASYISGIQKTISEEKMIRAIQEKIIQNNTNGTIEDFIESMKLHFNAEQVKVYESNPMNISVMLLGSKLELSSSGNQDAIKKCLPACVRLNNLYTDSGLFDLFLYSENSSYGDSRYPVLVGESTDIYRYISFSVNLSSQYSEYIKTNKSSFAENDFACIVGEISEVNNNAVFLSSLDQDDLGFEVKIYNDGEKDLLSINYNGVEYPSTIEAIQGSKYTIILYNEDNKLKAWFMNGVKIYGNVLDQDSSWIINQINYSTPSIEIDNFTTFDGDLYINCSHLNDDIYNNFGDFTYYSIVFGNTDTIEEYYVSCFGEKQILFNCLNNSNHLFIHTENPLYKDILVQHSNFNYKTNHSNGRYMYLDGKSSIDYTLRDNVEDAIINSFELSFDMCSPIEISHGHILSGLIGDEDDVMGVFFNENNLLTLEIPIYTDPEDETTKVIFNYKVNVENIGHDEYCNIKIVYLDNQISFYKNDVIINSISTTNITIKSLLPILNIGTNKNKTSYFRGILKNVQFNCEYSQNNETKSLEYSIPYHINLYDETEQIQYINNGARFITTPQLISDTTKKDLYGNSLIRY